VSGLSDLSAQQSEIRETLFALDGRISALEVKIGESSSVSPAPSVDPEIITELEALRAALNAQKSELSGMIDRAREDEAAAAEMARKARATGALAELRVALGTGAPYAEAMAGVTAAGVDLPPVLSEHAEEGLITLDRLIETFPEAARSALRAARSQGGDAGGGVVAFLERQLAVRSVAPREGDDADAVLSRAEAAVRAGDIDTALSELSGLAGAAKEEMQGWIATAQTRQDAVRAVDDLSQSLASN
jgi:hypothetical protein